MKYISKISLALLFISAAAFAQSENDSVKVNTLHFPSLESYEPVIPNFELYRELYFPEKDNPAEGTPGNIWLWTEYSISGIDSDNYLTEHTQPHMLANFHEMYIENSKFNIVRTVLAYAQLGAVGYLAYKSIKENGFWDMKDKNK